jgi:hypothetical protein
VETGATARDDGRLAAAKGVWTGTSAFGIGISGNRVISTTSGTPTENVAMSDAR